MQVTPSLFSAVKHDAVSVRRYVRNLSEGVALMTFPFAVGVALTAPELLTLALGDRWSGAILPLQVLAWTVPLRSILFVVPQALLMMGESRAIMWNAVRTMFVMLPAFLVGSRWGSVGVAAAWLLVFPFCMLPLFRKAMRRIDMPASEYYTCIRVPLLAVFVMAATVCAVELAIPDHWSLWLRAALKVAVGVMTYGLALWGIYPASRLATWKNLILRMRPLSADSANPAESLAGHGTGPH
jgi:O-antigen/teichoic acid export membrane protein